jgi:hypothetical protein
MDMDNPNVRRKESHKYGLGVYAVSYIAKGEFISTFATGISYQASEAMLLPNEPPDFAGRHAIQYAEDMWRDGEIDRIARYIAHSCKPNCGIKNLFDIVAIADINAGEELTWDYAMSEDSTFRMECLCATDICRGSVGSFSMLDSAQRKEFVERNKYFISDWLVKKYSLY